jgi:hypothetical protein
MYMTHFIKRYEEESKDDFRYKRTRDYDEESPKSEHSSYKSERDIDQLEKFMEDMKI